MYSLTAINQSINQSKRIYIAPYVAGESEARKCIHKWNDFTFSLFWYFLHYDSMQYIKLANYQTFSAH